MLVFESFLYIEYRHTHASNRNVDELEQKQNTITKIV